MNILVTGGAGYVGSHAARQIALSGMRPVVFDNLSVGRAEAVLYGPMVRGDLADIDSIRSAIKEYRIDAVLHFAASASVAESMDSPRKYFSQNVVNSLNLLNAMTDCGVPHIVFSSTCAVYGIPDMLPISEDDSLQPVNPYGESKLFIERVLRWYGEAYGIGWCALRYFNAAGADPAGEIGEVHEPETHLIPLLMQTAIGSRSSVTVYGNDYDTPDGTAIRDYIHVTDLAVAHTAALRYLRQGGPSGAFNLGTGRGYSVGNIIQSVERIANVRLNVNQASRRAGDPAVLIANADRARQTLGWTPHCSDLDTMLRTAWNWERSRRNAVRASAH